MASRRVDVATGLEFWRDAILWRVIWVDREHGRVHADALRTLGGKHFTFQQKSRAFSLKRLEEQVNG